MGLAPDPVKQALSTLAIARKTAFWLTGRRWMRLLPSFRHRITRRVRFARALLDSEDPRASVLELGLAGGSLIWSVDKARAQRKVIPPPLGAQNRARRPCPRGLPPQETAPIPELSINGDSAVWKTLRRWLFVYSRSDGGSDFPVRISARPKSNVFEVPAAGSHRRGHIALQQRRRNGKIIRGPFELQQSGCICIFWHVFST